MADKSYIVIAECVDNRNGKRFFPGDTFDPAPTEKQAAVLLAANCIEEGAAAQAAGDDLALSSDAGLRKIAKAEGIDISGAGDRDAVIAAIVAARAAKADGLDAIEGDALKAVATTEGVMIAAGATDADVRAAIRAKRAQA